MKEANQKGLHTVLFHLFEMSRVGKSRDRAMISGCPGLGHAWGGAGGRKWELEGAMVKCHGLMGFLFQVIKMF